jgi:hypothetical protein
MSPRQRTPVPVERGRPSERLWRPDLAGQMTDAELPPGWEPTPDDAYVVIDELSDGTAVLVVAPWPNLDGAGRLAFPMDAGPKEVAIAEADLRKIANAHRQRAGQVPRDVRVGDAFWVRGLMAKPQRVVGKPGAWGEMLDVTGAARSAAKAALYGAVAPRMKEAPVEAGEEEVREQLRPPPGPSAGPVV